MSQQLSIPTGSGLLSLNLSNLPQTANSQGGGAAPLFAGFSSMMSDVASEANQKGIAGGGFLPQHGIGLPQEIEGELALNAEQIKQRLLHLAEMLGQQGQAAQGEGALPADVMSELAKALRSYAEGEIPELPDEIKQKLDKTDVASLEVVESVESPDLLGAEQIDESQQATVNANASEAEHSENSVEENVLAVPEVTADSEGAQLQEGIASEDESVAVEEQEAQNTSAQPQILESDSEQASETESPVETAPTEGLVNETDVPSDDVVDDSSQQAQAAQESEPVSEQENEVEEPVVVAANDPRRSPVADAARQETIPDGFRNRGEYVSQVARGTNQGNSNAGQSPVQAETDGVDSQQPVRANSQTEAKPVESALLKNAAKGENQNSATPAVNGEQNAKAQETTQIRANNPLLSLDKFESMLEVSQKLMTKAAAAAEKIGDSPFSARSDNALASGTAAVPQSVSQPTQVQKAVAEANNLMMPQNVKLNSPAWSNALAERAVMIAAQNTRVAQIQLDPPELGSLNIRVQVNQDQVSLSFTSPHAHVRDAVEQSLPRLREMFAEQGLALQDSSVSDQQQSDSRREEFAGDQNRSDGGYLGQSSDGSADESDVQRGRPVSLVDYYA